jgi:hypothetical protein
MATLVGVLPEVGGVDREDEEGAEAASEEDVEGAEGSKGVLELALGINSKVKHNTDGSACCHLVVFGVVALQDAPTIRQKSQRKARHRGRHKAVHPIATTSELGICIDFSARHNTAMVLDKSSR